MSGRSADQSVARSFQVAVGRFCCLLSGAVPPPTSTQPARASPVRRVIALGASVPLDYLDHVRLV